MLSFIVCRDDASTSIFAAAKYHCVERFVNFN